MEILTGKRKLITRESAQSSIRNLNYSSRKIIDRLDLEFTDIHQTIAECAELCKRWIEDNEVNKSKTT